MTDTSTRIIVTVAKPQWSPGFIPDLSWKFEIRLNSGWKWIWKSSPPSLQEDDALLECLENHVRERDTEALRRLLDGNVDLYLADYRWGGHLVNMPSISGVNAPGRRSAVLLLILIKTHENDRTIHEEKEQNESGWNIERWTAIALIDTYFDEADENNMSTLPFYIRDVGKDEAEDMDPFSIGDLTADKFWAKDPREYFPLVIRYRAQRITEEWDNTCANLECRVRDYEGDFKVVKDCETWVNQTSRLLTRLMNMLEESVKSWYKFLEDIDRMTYQTSEEMASKIHGSFSDIAEAVEATEEIAGRLKSLEREITNFREQASLRS
ncbi:hypothetical protein CcaCcLH18_05060 [Colletotrichum camelliae]|nr:hypothetical protein CcaCcLH18_05060 [Colletotrichum camelliae]